MPFPCDVSFKMFPCLPRHNSKNKQMLAPGAPALVLASYPHSPLSLSCLLLRSSWRTVMLFPPMQAGCPLPATSGWAAACSLRGTRWASQSWLYVSVYCLHILRKAEAFSLFLLLSHSPVSAAGFNPMVCVIWEHRPP